MATNGSGKKPDDGKIVHLPTLAERDRMRKEKAALEKAQERKSRSAKNVPFFNFGKIPPFTRALVLVFLVIHAIIFLGMDSGQQLRIFYTMGFVPLYFYDALTGVAPLPWYAPMGIITHVFIHGAWFHLFVNLVMMLTMGLLFESTYGARITAIFFFLCAAFGAALLFALNPSSNVPVIGASGGISGLFGAALMMMSQRGQLRSFGRRGPWPIIGFWIVLMVVIGLASGGTIAWQAHVGGFIAGVALLHFMQKGKLKF